MEHLKSDLNNMIEHCKKLPSSPSTEQLQNKVRQLTTALDNDSTTAPRRIREMFAASRLVSTLENILNEVNNWSPPITPSAEELGDLSLACKKLWELDIHRLVPSKDYEINVQQGKSFFDDAHIDVCSEPLFKFVSEEALAKPTYAKFIALLDNYVASTGVAETVTAQELEENRQFLNMIMDTAVMQYVHQYLVQNGKVNAESREAFIRVLDDLWFGLYTRKVRNDSSGFEHVFVGEVKSGGAGGENEVTGLHNWVQIYLEEKRGKFDYHGYIKPKKRGLKASVPSSYEQFISIQFEWNGALKEVSSSFVGTSPEFEIALYTLCFFMQKSEKSVVTVGPYNIEMTCYKFTPRDNPKKVYIGTAFPSEAK